MNTRNFMKLMDENPQVETVTVVGAAVFAAIGAAVLFPLFMVWLAAIALLIKFKKNRGSHERPK